MTEPNISAMKKNPHIHIPTADKSPAIDTVYKYTQRWFKLNLNYSKKWMTKGSKQNKINSCKLLEYYVERLRKKSLTH